MKPLGELPGNGMPVKHSTEKHYRQTAQTLKAFILSYSVSPPFFRRSIRREAKMENEDVARKKKMNVVVFGIFT